MFSPPWLVLAYVQCSLVAKAIRSNQSFGDYFADTYKFLSKDTSNA